ncbi:hypothetical protein GYMLUDRAFT_239278 [Collybiopsis luxurians FD-317 M1]|nr:hypothetical protein GYMLUDRAFT_239278 [Collybiopsis luxurians FD-317 M1]
MSLLKSFEYFASLSFAPTLTLMLAGGEGTATKKAIGMNDEGSSRLPQPPFLSPPLTSNPPNPPPESSSQIPLPSRYQA